MCYSWPMSDGNDGRDPEIVIPGAEQAAQSAGEFIQQPAKLMRIAAMIKELLGEARESSMDDAGRKRLHQVYDRALAALRDSLSEELQQELATLTLPLGGSPSQSGIRLATLVVLVAVVGTVALGAADGLQRLYVLDCGRNTGKDQSRWSPGVNE